ncbi:unnamed protein product [Onchocerca flexuosa]|uniref:Uncharacterized protein n=1 Tax=Onchocerca flexuosa TaxID=387005 RepID=A0A183HCI9_9BILA|nr:unnamed protein product [Onchocerca flexuosa]
MINIGPIPQWRTPKSTTASPIMPIIISPTTVTSTTTPTTNERMMAVTTNNNNNNKNNSNSNNNHNNIDCDIENSPNDSKRSKSSEKSWENSLY